MRPLPRGPARLSFAPLHGKVGADEGRWWLDAAWAAAPAAALGLLPLRRLLRLFTREPR